MAKKYLDDTGMSYFWGKLKDYFQEKLVSGTNIKTINNETLLGSGNISVTSTQFVDANASGTISSANGYVDISISFTPPSGSVFLGTMLRAVSATSTINNITVLLPISDGADQSLYRVRSSAAQTVTIYARKLYLVTA